MFIDALVVDSGTHLRIRGENWEETQAFHWAKGAAVLEWSAEISTLKAP